MSKRGNSRKLAMRMLYQMGIRTTDLAMVFEDLDKVKTVQDVGLLIKKYLVNSD